MKTVHVVGAIIRSGKTILTTQRGYGKHKGYWEFPGGKIEPGETPEEALIREIREELDVEITIEQYVDTIEFDYPDFHLHMRVYFCRITEGEPKYLEHSDAAWLKKEELNTVNWLPADVDFIEKLKTLM